MSLESWKAEFYQLNADAEAVQVDDITRTRHALQKWIGLRPENMERHGVMRAGQLNIIWDGDNTNQLKINGRTCSLCVANEDDFGFTVCIRCPLNKHLGMDCDDNKDAPYNVWLNDNNPEPMITALQGTLEMLLEAQKKDNDNSVTPPADGTNPANPITTI